MKKQKRNEDNLGTLRKSAEELLQSTEQNSGVRPSSAIVRELQVHEIELQMQNEELVKTQARLSGSVKEYELLFEFSPSAYYILDKSGIVRNVNLEGCLQLQFEKSGLVSQPFSKFLPVEADQDEFYRFRARAMQESKVIGMECEMRRKDGTTFPAMVRCTAASDELHQKNYLLTMVTDISVVRNHQLQIQAALKSATDLNEMKSRFVAMASHEFRTPLATVLTSANLVERYAENDEKENMLRHLNRIKNSVSQLTMILNEFLSLDRLESGNFALAVTEMDLPEFCKVLLEDFRPLQKSGQRIEYVHTGPEEIVADKSVLKHVLVNLLTNACKYSEQGQAIEFQTAVHDDQIRFVVKDHGIGIPEDEQQNTFTRFFRANNVVAIQGTGLGLNIARRYVELVQGKISFTSQPHQGTTFVVEIPRNG